MKQTKKIQPNPVQRQQPKKNDLFREHTDKANNDGKGNTHGTEEGSEEKSKQSCEDTNVSPITKMDERVAVSKSVKDGNSNKKLGSKKPNTTGGKNGIEPLTEIKPTTLRNTRSPVVLIVMEIKPTTPRNLSPVIQIVTTNHGGTSQKVKRRVHTERKT